MEYFGTNKSLFCYLKPSIILRKILVKILLTITQGKQRGLVTRVTIYIYSINIYIDIDIDIDIDIYQNPI